MKNNRIGLYLASYSGGGAEREMIYLANEFLSKGYSVDLIVHRNTGPLKSLVSCSINQIIIDKSYINDFFILLRYMRNVNPDFILSTLHLPNWILAISKLFSRTNVKISWRIVTSLSSAKKHDKSIIVKMFSLYYLLSPKVDLIVAVSQGVADDLITKFHLPKEKISVFHNPAYSRDIHVLSQEPIEHKWLNKKYKTVVSLGRLAVPKDFKTLISAFRKVSKKIENARLLILGDGPLRNELQNQIKQLDLSDTVELLGFDVNPYKFLSRANLFVLSSIYEGFGNVIVEAMALNIPIVSTDCPFGPAEILENGKWGKLVPVGNDELMANAIIESLKLRLTCSTLTHAKQFNVKNLAEKYIQSMGNISQPLNKHAVT